MQRDDLSRDVLKSDQSTESEPTNSEAALLLSVYNKPGTNTISRSNEPASLGDTFDHAPLNLKKASIRLIEVLPSNPDETIQCRVTHSTTDAHYTCLSYVWGSSTQTRQILMNGKPFQVRQNLWDFLNVARSFEARKKNLGIHIAGEGAVLNFEQATHALWIDALCIDQGNNGERNHQVQQMGSIFSGSQYVLAWMGVNVQIASMFRYVEKDMYAQPFFDAKHFLGLCDFGQNIYWKRAWITQEVQLSQRLFFIADAEALGLEKLFTEVGPSVRRTFGPLIYRDMLQAAEDTLVRQHKTTRVLDNMYRFRSKQCSNILDLAYSVLAVSSDGKELEVNYQISKEALARNIIALYGTDFRLWHASTIWKILSLEEKTLPFNISHRFAEVEASSCDFRSDTCPTCRTVFKVNWVNHSSKVDKVYLHCIYNPVQNAQGSSDVIAHLCLGSRTIIPVSHKSGDKAWFIFIFRSSWSKPEQVDFGLDIGTVNSGGISALIHLSFDALCQIDSEIKGWLS